MKTFRYLIVAVLFLLVAGTSGAQTREEKKEALKTYVFVSDNIMDYSISYSNKFTSDQAERIRYILEKGVFVPGPKNRTNETKSRSIGKLDLPMTIMK